MGLLSGDGTLAAGWRRGVQIAFTLLDAFFHPRDGWLYRLASWAWLAALLVYGAYLLTTFFGRGDIPFDFVDWGEVTGPRYALLRDASERGLLPLHASNTTGLRGVTDRFLAIADTPFSPQFALMRYFELGEFIFLDTLLLYAIGFAGLAWIFFRYRLSLAAFTTLFFLYNFNGHLIGHLAVGHANWVGHYLLPFFVLAVLALLEGARGWRWVFGLAGVMLAILLQGGFHLYVWCLLFLAALVVAYPRLWLPVLLGGLFTGLVSMVRLLPPAVDLNQMDPEFINGFTSVFDLLRSLVVLRHPQQAFQELSFPNMLGSWELNTYIGTAGALFIGYFGVYRLLRRSTTTEAGAERKWLLLPVLFLTVLSLGMMYVTFTRFVPVPLLAGERVTTRILIVPVIVLATLAALEFQRYLNERRQSPREQLLWLALPLLVRFDLTQHLKMWRIRYLDGFTEVFPKIPVDLSLHQVANRPDPAYTGLLLAGAIISALALIFLAVMSWREWQNSRATPNNSR